jgi:hypothetical protein
VNVTASPRVDGFGDAVNAVTVSTRAGSVVDVVDVVGVEVVVVVDSAVVDVGVEVVVVVDSVVVDVGVEVVVVVDSVVVVVVGSVVVVVVVVEVDDGKVASIVLLSVAELFAGSGSVTPAGAATVAVLDSSPLADGSSVAVAV